MAEVFDGANGTYAGTVNLVSRYSADPTPDLPGPRRSAGGSSPPPAGQPPLSGDPHSSQGSHPGMLVIRLDNAGVTGEVRGLVPITNRDVAGVERADAHAIRVRRL